MSTYFAYFGIFEAKKWLQLKFDTLQLFDETYQSIANNVLRYTKLVLRIPRVVLDVLVGMKGSCYPQFHFWRSTHAKPRPQTLFGHLLVSTTLAEPVFGPTRHPCHAIGSCRCFPHISGRGCVFLIFGSLNFQSFFIVSFVSLTRSVLLKIRVYQD